MDQPKDGITRQKSAVLTGELVEQSASGMMLETVPVGTWLFGFDPTDPKNMERFFKCDADASREWTQHTTEPFLLETWAVQKIELASTEENRGGICVRTVLIDPTGDTLSFVSQGVTSSLDLIRALLGDGPFVPPLPICIEKITTGGGRGILKLRPRLDKLKPKTK